MKVTTLCLSYCKPLILYTFIWYGLKTNQTKLLCGLKILRVFVNLIILLINLLFLFPEIL